MKVTKAAIDRFEQALSLDKHRIPIELLWDAMAKALPEQIAGDSRQTLHALITGIELRGFSLPKTKKLFDHTAQPPLPKWVQQPEKANDDKILLLEPKTYLWARELTFLADGRRLPNYQQWQMLDNWLKSGGRNAPIVAVRERSFEIFNDEKLLDEFSKTQPFKQGRIELSVLRCVITPEPLAWEKGPSGSESKPCLVVENSATWRTLSLWNRDNGAYSSVVYGGGNKFSQTWQGLELIREIAPFDLILYFGDVDYDGLMIPFRAARNIHESLDVSLILDIELYEVLRCAVPKNRWCKNQQRTINDDLLNWLPAKLKDWLVEVISNHFRIPQEGLQRKHMVPFNKKGSGSNFK
ncbi:MAG: hypothetical protein DRQ49_01740 [Gammaproteobacteria bacterium]|nr:MAG: hypothetical protein DRQ49_01740 [Gammaproteobacteria bacterium]RKZ75034.1 MAG: hypothetical protein DRQ57_08920 [Gammaproteobacteria bacterium]